MESAESPAVSCPACNGTLHPKKTAIDGPILHCIKCDRRYGATIGHALRDRQEVEADEILILATVPAEWNEAHRWNGHRARARQSA